MAVPSITLPGGYKMPAVGLGTWKSKKNEVQNAVEVAIDCGYRHIDCAWAYRNENEVGTAISNKIKEGKIKREDIFVTSKLWSTFHKPEVVRSAFMESLNNFKLDYLDLYLMHFPVAFKYRSHEEQFPMGEDGVICEDIDYVDTWKAMEALQKEGLVRNIGVSNFNEYQMKRIVKEATVPVAVNQVELHPYLNQNNLVECCKSLNVTVTAYSPLGSADRPWATKDEPVLLEDPKLKEIASRVKKTVAQVAIKFQIQRGLIVIPKSVTPSRIESNIQLFDFELSKDDMDTIYSLEKNFRTCTWTYPKHKYSPFRENYSE